jgi:NAD-dependent deacetylase
MNVVFFGGAGVSTASGIPDFRSTDGLYNQEYRYPPEQIISHSFFNANTSEFYRFYRNKMLFPEAEPNQAHIWLAEHQIPVITQNIDGLHQKAGSKQVWELHGSVWRNYCTKCRHFLGFEDMVGAIDAAADNVPRCSQAGCSGIMKPDVVLYEEGLDNAVWSEAERAVRNADVLIIGGTSLIVYPAASMVRYFRGQHLVVINKEPLDISGTGNMQVHQINQPIADVLRGFDMGALLYKERR